MSTPPTRMRAHGAHPAFQLLLLFSALVLLPACQRGRDAKSHFRIGVTPIPAGEVMTQLLPELAREGVPVELVQFTDYIQPNLALAAGDIDANLYQHEPFLQQFNHDHGTDLVAVAPVYIAPLALYPGRTKSLSALPEGSRVAVPNDPVNLGRALRVLESAGLVELAAGPQGAITTRSISRNPRNLTLVELEAAQLPRALPDVEAAVINANYALDAGLHPLRDGWTHEGRNSGYANVLAVKRGRERDAQVLVLSRLLHSETVTSFLNGRYQGAVIPVF